MVKIKMIEEVLACMTMEEIIKESSFSQWLMEEGEKLGMQRTLTQLPATRFGPLPSWAEKRLTTADRSSLNRWTTNFVSAASVEDCLN